MAQVLLHTWLVERRSGGRCSRQTNTSKPYRK